MASSRPPRPTSQTAMSTRGAAEELEGRGRRHLEERRMHLERAVAPQIDRPPSRTVGDACDQRLRGDRPAVDGEPLGEIDQVRRGVAAGSVAGRTKRGVDHRRDRALAVRARRRERIGTPARDGRGGRRSRAMFSRPNLIPNCSRLNR